MTLHTKTVCVCVCACLTFGRNERSFALITGSSLIHSFDVEEIILVGLQKNCVYTALDTRDGSGKL